MFGAPNTARADVGRLAAAALTGRRSRPKKETT